MVLTKILLVKCKNQILTTFIIPKSATVELFRNANIKRGIILVNIISLSHGIAFGWLSPTLPLLQSENTPLASGPITVEETSWIGSIVTVGAICGCFLFGYLVDVIGRKISLCVLPITYLVFSGAGEIRIYEVFWATVRFATNPYYLYVGRVFSGCGGGGVYILIPLIVSEISNNEIRGILGSMFMVSMNLGILLGYILSSYLEYETVPYIAFWMPIVFFILIAFFIPETPLYLIKKKRYDAAERSLKFFLNMNPVTEQQIEVFQKKFDELKKSVSSESKNNKVTLKDLWEPEARRGFFIGIFLVILMQSSAYFAIISYAANILKLTHAEFDIYTGTIIIGAVQFLGTLSSAFIVDKAGRKILLAISAGGSAIGLGVLGTFCLFTDTLDMVKFNWVPVTCLCFVVFITAIGLSSLPVVIIGELLPNKVRSTFFTMLMTLVSVLGFITIKIFPILMEILELSTIMYIFMSICVVGTFLVYIIVPETKGKVLN